MERLDVSIAPDHANIEAAIHFARYAIGKNLVQGKRVLDIACGEGYGSFLLKEAGAASVVGVDISAETVSRAQEFFAKDGLEYVHADAAEINNLFDENTFDVVISIETIEHLKDPAAFLNGVKRVVKPGGIIVLSCPNDYWYYPRDDESNPYHLRKYRLEEFQDLSTSILGNNVRWSLGTSVFGFGSVPLKPKEAYKTIPGTWMSYMEASSAYFVSGDNGAAIPSPNSSFYIGVWNAPDWQTGVAVYPVTMDDYAKMVSAQLDAYIPGEPDINSGDARALGLKIKALEAEGAIMRESIASMQEYYNRYVRLTRLIPQPLRHLCVKIVRALRSA